MWTVVLSLFVVVPISYLSISMLFLWISDFLVVDFIALLESLYRFWN